MSNIFPMPRHDVSPYVANSAASTRTEADVRADRNADFLAMVARIATPIQPIYPLYHASIIKKALTAAIPSADGMIVDVSDVQTVGDCRYAITTTDHAGQSYRITIAVESGK